MDLRVLDEHHLDTVMEEVRALYLDCLRGKRNYGMYEADLNDLINDCRKHKECTFLEFHSRMCTLYVDGYDQVLWVYDHNTAYLETLSRMKNADYLLIVASYEEGQEFLSAINRNPNATDTIKAIIAISAQSWTRFSRNALAHNGLTRDQAIILESHGLDDSDYLKKAIYVAHLQEQPTKATITPQDVRDLHGLAKSRRIAPYSEEYLDFMIEEL